MSRARIPTWLCAAIAAWGVISACGGAQTPPNDPSKGGDDPLAKPTAEPKAEPAVALPGKCVDPVVDGNNHDGTRPFDKKVQDDNHFSGDLDDDGFPDQAVEPAWSCGETCTRSLYVMRKSCGHYVGSVGSQHRFDVVDDKHHGLHDVAAYPTSYEADNTKHCWEVRYQFDGAQYKAARKRECDCKMTATTKRCEQEWEELGQ